MRSRTGARGHGGRPFGRTPARPTTPPSPPRDQRVGHRGGAVSTSARAPTPVAEAGRRSVDRHTSSSRREPYRRHTALGNAGASPPADGAEARASATEARRPGLAERRRLRPRADCRRGVDDGRVGRGRSAAWAGSAARARDRPAPSSRTRTPQAPPGVPRGRAASRAHRRSPTGMRWRGRPETCRHRPPRGTGRCRPCGDDQGRLAHGGDRPRRVR
jgi:hypothetical protein